MRPILRLPRASWREGDLVMYVGRRGTGKTLALAQYGVKQMRKGRTVYANFELWDEKCGQRAGRVWNWTSIEALRDAVVLIDEVHMWAGSRFFKNTPDHLIKLWAQSRKDGLDLRMTVQHEARAEVILRELTDEVVLLERPRFLRWMRLPLFRETALPIEEIEAIRKMPEQLERNPRHTWRFRSPKYALCYDTREKIDVIRFDRDGDEVHLHAATPLREPMPYEPDEDISIVPVPYDVTA